MSFKPEINTAAWLKSVLGFIRSKDLERECSDWCGGWPLPKVGSHDEPGHPADKAQRLPSNPTNPKANP